MQFRMLSFLSFYSVVVISIFISISDSFSIQDHIKGGKRTNLSIENFASFCHDSYVNVTDKVNCPTWQPFKCPNGDCVPIKYLCDGSPDCDDEYDENESMCTAATRPPVEETAAFLKALLVAHGDDFLVKVFGSIASNRLHGMGGVDKVAVALSESPTFEHFGRKVGMSKAEIEKMLTLMYEIYMGSNAGLSENEAADFRFFVQKLQETGFF